MSKLEAVRARIYILRPDEGGRRKGIFSGYRPGIWWDGLEEMGGNDGRLIIEGEDKCLPGDECLIRIEFYHPEFLPDAIDIGSKFAMREGRRIIGRGQVIGISE